eukprot:gene21229-28145_t
MDKQVADSSYFRAQQLSKRILEAEFNVQLRYSRYPTKLPARLAVESVLIDEQIDVQTLTFLMKELGRHGSAQQLSIALFDWLMECQSPLLCKQLFDAAISPQTALRIFADMQAMECSQDLTTFNMVLTCLGQAGLIDEAMKEAIDAVQALKDATGFPVPRELTNMLITICEAAMDKKTYIQAISVVSPPHAEELDSTPAIFHQAGDLDTALAVFHELNAMLNGSSGVCESSFAGYGTRVYNATIRACAKRGQWQTAQIYFDNMGKPGQWQTAQIYVDNVGKDGSIADTGSYGALSMDGLVADTGSYGALITACLNGGALDHALEVYEWMVAGRDVNDEIPADIKTYNTLIEACHQAGHLEKALEIMSWVGSTGIAFDTKTYDGLINTVEIAQIWDKKAISIGAANSLAVYPEHLRPAPCDEMRMMYLQHLGILEEEEILANTKLGAPSWAPASLTRGSSTQNQPVANGIGGLASMNQHTTNQRGGNPYSPVCLSRMPNVMGMSMDTVLHRLPPMTADGENNREEASGATPGYPGSPGFGSPNGRRRGMSSPRNRKLQPLGSQSPQRVPSAGAVA